MLRPSVPAINERAWGSGVRRGTGAFMTSIAGRCRAAVQITLAVATAAMVSGCAVGSVMVSTVELAGSAVSATADVAGSAISTTADGIGAFTDSEDDALPDAEE